MKLLTLRLENFQGLKSEEFKFDGCTTSIYGDNATGKTTVFNALTWLLFDKASTGAKNFTPKTKGHEGDLHFLSHAAEAAFCMDDGRIVSLRKVFHENYKNKRGSAVKEFDGHSVDFYIDRVPVKEKDYEEAMLSFCGGNIEKMKMLTMPDYFPEEMAWDARREILLEICGDVSDDDVINSAPELKELPQYLLMPGTTGQYYTVVEYKKIAGAKKADINKQLQEIPGRIDEAQRAMPDITGLDEETINLKIKELAKRKSELETEKAQALNGDLTMVAIRNQTSEANARLAEARVAYATKCSSKNEGTYTAIGDIKKKQIVVKNHLQDAKNDLERAQRNAEKLNSRREALLNDYAAIQQETWNEDNEICPTCHRTLPEEEVQKLREAFNLQKSRRLEKINTQGQKDASKEMIAEQTAKIKELNGQIEEDERLIEDYEQQIATLHSELQTPEPFENTEEYSEISAQIAALQNEASDMDKKTETIVAGYTEKIQMLYDEIRQQEEMKTRIMIAAGQRERIAELEGREKEFSGQYEGLEKGIYLCELFIKAKVKLLTDRINGKFRNVRFRLFVEQQNGGVREDCEVMVPSSIEKYKTGEAPLVPFVFANNAARINAGLEIIETLSHHWNLTMPVFIDNAESVTRINLIDTQVIRLVVSERDKVLRLEVAV